MIWANLLYTPLNIGTLEIHPNTVHLSMIIMWQPLELLESHYIMTKDPLGKPEVVWLRDQAQILYKLQPISVQVSGFQWNTVVLI